MERARPAVSPCLLSLCLVKPTISWLQLYIYQHTDLPVVSIFSSNFQQESEKAYFPERVTEAMHTIAFCHELNVKYLV